MIINWLVTIVILCLLIGCATTLYENHATRKENRDLRKENRELGEELFEYSQLVLRFWSERHPLLIVSLEDIRKLHKYGGHKEGEQYSLLGRELGGELDLTLEYRTPPPPLPFLSDLRKGSPPETNEHGTEIR